MRALPGFVYIIAATCILFFCTNSVSAQAQIDINRVSLKTEIEQVLTGGQQLENDGRWDEAFSYYQQATRKFPQSNEIKRRRSIARLHYDVDRRCADTSFHETVLQTSESDALNVYAEVLLKVDSYYVHKPNWQGLVEYGMSSLITALGKQQFRQINHITAGHEQTRAAVDFMQRSIGQYQVANRQDAFMVASSAARLLNQKIGLKPSATIYEFICGAIVALDPYSSFMTSNQYSETMSQIEGSFVGLGVELKTETDHLLIVSVLRGGPASSAGIIKGDKIMSVDGTPVARVGSEKAADMLRGLEGSTCKVTIERGDQTGTLSMQRRRVDIPSVEDVKIVDRQNNIGYIRLSNFQKTTVRDFDNALWDLHKQGMKCLIVDVRGNPGGLLNSAVEISDRFLTNGVVVSTHGRNPLEDYVHRAKLAGTWRVPLVVLVDENSASASEIFAAAVNDQNRGTIVGSRSYGKGSVQGIFPLNTTRGGIRLTTAKFYSPNGTPISQRGVTPAIVVQAAKPATEGSTRISDSSPADAVLATGIKIAQRKLGS